MQGVLTAVALNPAIDRTLHVSGFRAGATNRASMSREDPGGKGINVAGVLKSLGAPVQVVGFLGGTGGELIARHLTARGIPGRFVYVDGETRVNLKIVDPTTHDLTEVNAPGFAVTAAELELLREYVKAALAESAVLILAGSLPAGVPATFYRDLVELARAAGVPAVVDADGEPLAQALQAQPTLIKPNRAEAARLLGRTLSTRGDEVAAARALQQRGAGTVVLSSGAQGAGLVNASGAWWATPPAIEVGSTVGAGDSMVAALSLALMQGLPAAEALRLATAAGAAAASQTGTEVSPCNEIERLKPLVHITSL